MNKFCLIFFGIWFLIFGISKISASDEFTTDYDITYLFDPSGKSTVSQKITLTNRQTGVYAPSFTFKVLGETPSNIKVSSQGKPQQFTISKPTQDSTDITITFSDPATGRGQANVFTLSYDGRPAVKNGQIWELSLAKLANPNLADGYQVHLVTSRELGNPAYMSPRPHKVENTKPITQTYHFQKEQVISSGVVAGFGNFQTLDFKLHYHLQNSTAKTIISTVALPPDTSLQRLFYDSLDPRPTNVTIDPDGNWLADYKLKPNQNQLVIALGQVHLLGTPISPGRLKYSTDQLATYLSQQEYWPSQDETFRSRARTNSTPKSIFDYVVATLSYDYGRLNTQPIRKGALQALKTPETSICTDFTDVYITLSRAAGIPSREHQGYALSTDPKLQPLSLITDVLHAWPEYWDTQKEVWRSVDPTWTKTTGGVNYFDSLDLSHFTFVIHGQNSSRPLPAGFYKTSPDSKDISIEIGAYRDFFSSAPELKWHLPLFILPLIKLPASLTIINPNGSAEYDLGVKLTSSDLTVVSGPQVVSAIPPYGQVTANFSLIDSLFSITSKKIIYAQIGSHLVAYNIPEAKFYLWYVILILIGSSTIIGLAIVAHRSWHLHIQRQHSKDNLYRQGQEPQK